VSHDRRKRIFDLRCAVFNAENSADCLGNAADSLVRHDWRAKAQSGLQR
jgi:hypothetical protein